MRPLLAALVSVSLLAACGSSAPAATSPTSALTIPDPTPKGPTYWKDVSPIVDAKCAQCHTAGGIGPFTFDDYATVKAFAPSIAQQVKAKRMPPWPPAKGCGDFEADRSLSAEQIATITAWNDAGAIEGNVADKPPVQKQQLDETLGKPSATLTQKAAYTSASTASDDYRCFVVDPNLAEDAFVVASGIRPGNARIVHHVILFEAPSGQLAKVQALDDKEPGEGYTCFGGPGFDDTEWITSWAPGATASRYPAGTGIKVRKGSKLVMQVHYNLANGRGESDQTKVDLYYSAVPVKQAYILPVPQLLLSIPKDTKEAVVGFDYTMQPDDPTGLVYGSAGHMHLLGKKFSMKVQHADGSQDCLLNLPRYDFHWQGMYMYKQPLALKAGDTLKMTCVFDNSQENQPWINGVQQRSKDVTWGEKTTDEMCLGLIYVTGS